MLVLTRFVASSVTVLAYSCEVDSALDFDVSHDALTEAPTCTGPNLPVTLTPTCTPKFSLAVCWACDDSWKRSSVLKLEASSCSCNDSVVVVCDVRASVRTVRSRRSP